MTSFPFELFLGYGLLAVVCQRCGAEAYGRDSGVCPVCGEPLDDVGDDECTGDETVHLEEPSWGPQEKEGG